VLGRLGQLSSPDVSAPVRHLRTPSPIRHLRTPNILTKECPEWKAQQKILLVEARKETGKWKTRCRTQDRLADERCSRAVLDFHSSTDVARRVPAEEDTVSEVLEAELRESED